MPKCSVEVTRDVEFRGSGAIPVDTLQRFAVRFNASEAEDFGFGERFRVEICSGLAAHEELCLLYTPADSMTFSRFLHPHSENDILHSEHADHQ